MPALRCSASLLYYKGIFAIEMGAPTEKNFPIAILLPTSRLPCILINMFADHRKNSQLCICCLCCMCVSSGAGRLSI